MQLTPELGVKPSELFVVTNQDGHCTIKAPVYLSTAELIAKNGANELEPFKECNFQLSSVQLYLRKIGWKKVNPQFSTVYIAPKLDKYPTGVTVLLVTEFFNCTYNYP